MEPKTTTRPWGSFREYALNEPATVKIITVKVGEALSLQTHERRSEFWRVVSGTPDIVAGDAVTHAKPGDEFFIPPKTPHRITAVGHDVEVLEVSRGDFDEADIVRLEDKYGRTAQEP